MRKDIVNRRNKTIDLKKFNKRLTGWTKFGCLADIVADFIKDNKNGYGIEFVIKRNNISKKFAIFIHEDNQQQRVDDVQLRHNVGDLLITALRNKREGISVFKTFMMYS